MGCGTSFRAREAVDFVKEALTSNIKSSEYGDATAMTDAFDKRHSQMGRLLVEEALEGDHWITRRR